MRHSYYITHVAPGFQTSVMALVTFRAPSVKKWSFYENEKKFGDSLAESENPMAVSVKI